MGPDELEADLTASARALAEGDLPHATFHVADALAVAPRDERVLAQIEALAARGDLVELVGDQDHLGAVALRAHGLARAGRRDEAIVLLAQVAELASDAGFEVQLAHWLTASPAQRLDAAASVQLARLLAITARTTVGLHRLLPGERALLDGYGELALACARGEPDHVLAAPVAGMLRRTGRTEDALAIADRFAAGAPHVAHVAHVQRGLALRTAGDGRGAAAAFAAAAALEPSPSPPIEEARSWFVAGDHARALALLDGVDADADPEVAGLARACAGPPPADPIAILDDLRRRALAPSVGAPGDATLNLFVEHGATMGAPGAATVRVAVSGWESPSNRLLAALYATGTGDVTRVDYTIDRIPLTPDPLVSRRGARSPLWIEQRGIMVQAPSLDPALREHLAAAGGDDDAPAAMWARAEAVADWLGPDQGRGVARELVHPPETAAFLATLPAGLYRYQLAGACVLACLPDPWSVKRPLFESIVFGPVDWTGAAAIVALAELAHRDAAHARDARALLLAIVDDLVPHACEPRFIPLLGALRRLPAVPPPAMSTLREWYQRYLAPDGPGTGHHGDG